MLSVQALSVNIHKIHSVNLKVYEMLKHEICGFHFLKIDGLRDPSLLHAIIKGGNNA